MVLMCWIVINSQVKGHCEIKKYLTSLTLTFKMIFAIIVGSGIFYFIPEKDRYEGQKRHPAQTAAMEMICFHLLLLYIGP